jgi:polyketide cyclase/dehydrase/lipid transport protein
LTAHPGRGVTVAAYEPPRRLVLGGQMGKMAPTVTQTVEPQGDGSRFTRRVEMEPPGIMRLMAPFMGGTFRKKNAGFVANLKRVLEAS